MITQREKIYIGVGVGAIALYLLTQPSGKQKFTQTPTSIVGQWLPPYMPRTLVNLQPPRQIMSVNDMQPPFDPSLLPTPLPAYPAVAGYPTDQFSVPSVAGSWGGQDGAGGWSGRTGVQPRYQV